MYETVLFSIKREHIYLVLKPVFVMVTIAAYFRAIGSLVGVGFVY